MLFILAALLAGCGTYGTKFSWDVFRSQEGSVVQANKADQAYWEALGKSYQPGGEPGTVTSAPMKVPAFYQNGLLINRSGQAVTFVITGQKSLTRTLPAGATAAAALPPGNYWVEIYYQVGTTPYRQAGLEVDRERGDCDIDGQVCDFFMIAP